MKPVTTSLIALGALAMINSAALADSQTATSAGSGAMTKSTAAPAAPAAAGSGAMTEKAAKKEEAKKEKTAAAAGSGSMTNSAAKKDAAAAKPAAMKKETSRGSGAN